MDMGGVLLSLQCLQGNAMRNLKVSTTFVRKWSDSASFVEPGKLRLLKERGFPSNSFKLSSTGKIKWVEKSASNAEN